MKLAILLTMCVLALLPPLYSRYAYKIFEESMEARERLTEDQSEEVYQIDDEDEDDDIPQPERGYESICESVSTFWAPLNLFFD